MKKPAAAAVHELAVADDVQAVPQDGGGDGVDEALAVAAFDEHSSGGHSHSR